MYKFRANLKRFAVGILSLDVWCGYTCKHTFSNFHFGYGHDNLKLYRFLHYIRVHQPEHLCQWQNFYQHDFNFSESNLHKLTIDDFRDCCTDLPF